MKKRMLPRDQQLAIERTYSRKFIDQYIEKELRVIPENRAKVEEGINLLD